MTHRPSFGEAIEAAFGSQLGEFRAVEPGEVTAWDRSDQVVTVRPVILGADRSARAAIHRCAVVFPGACWDIQLGEVGLLLVCDADYRRWWRDDEDAVPQTTASHAIGNSVFLPGLRSLPQARTIPIAAMVLETPSAGGTVRLGDPSADKAAVHEVFLDDLDTFLALFDAWAILVGVATGVVWAGQPVQAALTAIRIKIAADDYQSPSVMVED